MAYWISTVVVRHQFCHVEAGLRNFIHQPRENLILADGVPLFRFDRGQHAGPIGRQPSRF